MTDFATAAAAMSHSPLIRFLVGIALIVGAFKAVMFIADVVVGDMVNEAALAVTLDLATDPDPFDWSADTLNAWADPFAQTRRDIAALETTEERP